MPKKKVEDVYVKLTQLEHVLKRPDTYVGSIDSQSEAIWVWDEQQQRMVHRTIEYVPALFKIFDEILVNAADNKQRDPTMSYIEVQLDREQGKISVKNDGRGLPIEMHPTHNIYVPELIFGNLLTSSNYNDTEKKTTGGRNGFGAKLANIFSTKFVVETVDSQHEQKYSQTFSDNMQKKSKPKLTANSGKDYTKISFWPDFSKFGVEGFDDDTMALFAKRVWDLAGTSDKSLKVKLNGKVLKVKSFKDYVAMFVENKENAPVIYEELDTKHKWQIALTASEGTFNQVSYVNSISTSKGGTHVNAVTDKIAKAIEEKIKKMKSFKGKVTKGNIKNHLFVFVNCMVVNPAFGSQTKTELTNKQSSFGSKIAMPEAFVKKLLKSSIVKNITEWATLKASKDFKKSDGKKTTRITGIDKLDDANDAGGKNSAECTLILTEGDSAKALAMAGLTIVGRDRYGVFPLKGKLLNVKDAAPSKIQNNVEITNIKKIMGLKAGVDYSVDKNFRNLRYGSILIMADQDFDGSHIKGLVINFVAHYWPQLLKKPGFLQQFITPIVVCKKRNQRETFYTMPQYDQWCEDNDGGKGWTMKYYKGLGTSTSSEAKEYFSDLVRHKLKFRHLGQVCDDAIDLAFNKKRADARKQWLADWQPGTFVDYTRTIAFNEFIDKEFILFSRDDCARSIPSVVDGLKPSQRKILFACFKRKLTKEIKVAQLAGYVSEHSAYHHGEKSLCDAIVGMAQNFCGSNNINFLFPAGQFGTRATGGKDAASPRYIFTRLCGITRAVFHPTDDVVVGNQAEDGQVIEPTFYAPVLPTVLVNGAQGIGTGWSTNVPMYNPREIIENLRRLLDGDEAEEMSPWYKNWHGSITDEGDNKYRVEGVIEKLDEHTVRITELPISGGHCWTDKYKKFLEDEMSAGRLTDFRQHHLDNTVDFSVRLSANDPMSGQIGSGAKKYFKLSSSLGTSNMVLFDRHGKIRRFATVADILADFYELRLSLYEKRKEYLVAKLSMELDRLSNRMRFILAVINGELVISNRRKQAIETDMHEMGFRKFTKKLEVKLPWMQQQHAADQANGDGDEEEADDHKASYDYLLSMPLWSLTKEKVDKLRGERDAKSAELEDLKSTQVKTLWRRDLDAVEAALQQHEDDEKKLEQKANKLQKKTKKTKTTKGSSKSRSGALKAVKLTETNAKTKKESVWTSPVVKKTRKRAAAAPQEPKVKAEPKSKALKIEPNSSPSSSSTKSKQRGIESFLVKKEKTTKVKTEASKSRAKWKDVGSDIDSDSDSDFDDKPANPETDDLKARLAKRKAPPAAATKSAKSESSSSTTAKAPRKKGPQQILIDSVAAEGGFTKIKIREAIKEFKQQGRTANKRSLLAFLNGDDDNNNDDDDDDDDSDEIDVVKPEPAKRKRLVKKSTLAESESDSDDDSDAEMVEAAKPVARRAGRQAADKKPKYTYDSGSEDFEVDEDSGSEFSDH